MKKPKYFKAYELVSKAVYEKYTEETILARMNPRLIDLLDWIRELAGIGLVVNNWKNGGSFSQRGYRANTDPIVKEKTMKGSTYLSAHCLFMAVDMNPVGSSGKSTKWLYELIKKNAPNAPCSFRMESIESAPTWVHVDVAIGDDEPKGKKRCYIFKA